MRNLVDGLGLVHFFWQTPYFRLPQKPAREALLAALGPRPYPRVTASAPVLVELWRQREAWQLHLVNYALAPQPVWVEFGHAVAGRMISPDSPDGQFEGAILEFDLDVYAILQVATPP